MTDQKCLACAIVELIASRHPGGMDLVDASEALRCLAIVAGDILAHGDNANLVGFVTVVDMARDQNAGRVKIVDRTLN